MKANIQLIQKRRKFSVEFKKSLVDEFESGKFSVCQLGRMHKIKPQVIYNWLYKYSSA
ncbi:transposase, partial [Rhodobacteraceae bacterium B1Z28]|nr:transposase [Ruegeria haliotis]